MKKIFIIGWKDLTLAFRDRAALILMLAAPFALTLGLGFVTGRFSGTPSNTGLNDIPVIIVNYDGGQLGKELVSVFESDDLNTLVAPTFMDDEAQARQKVDEDQAAAVVIVPAGFTDSIIPPAGSDQAGEPVQIMLYTNPARPTSSNVVRAIVAQFANQVEVGRAGGQVMVKQLIENGLIRPADAAQVGAQIGTSQGKSTESIRIQNVTSQGEAVRFDTLALLAPGMALMFLMFTVSNGGRTLLAEKAMGTLPRLLVTPTSSTQVLGGKIFGIYLTGAAQMFILILASTLLFQLEWGDPLAVIALVLAAVAGATGWGMVITALAKTPGQVGAVGSAVMLLFGILGGSFISLDSMPAWFQTISKITPNSWGLDGFITLAMGGALTDILPAIAALLAMGALLFSAAVFLMTRRGIARQ